MDSRAWSKVISANLAFLILAFCGGLLGPTLPELQRIAKVDTDVISWLATGKSLGQLVGSLLGGVAIEHIPRGWVNCLSMLLTAPCVAVIPFFSSVIPMIVTHVLFGFISAFMVVGVNMEIIQIGGNNNGPMLQALHCIYNVGLLIAPIVVQPFLSEKTNHDNENSAEVFVQSDLDEVLEKHGWSRIVVPYVIAGLLMLVMSLTYGCVLCATKLSKAKTPTGYLTETQPEGTQLHMRKNRILILVLVFIFFVFCCLMEITYTTFLATFAVDFLGWSDKSAASLTSVFILALTIGRFLGIFVIKVLHASKVIWCGLILGIVGIVPLYFLEYSTIIIWISSSIFGLAIAPLYATTLTWTDEQISLSPKFGSILIFGGCVGYTVGPFLQGLLFSHFGILSFVYLCTAALACALFLRTILVLCVSKMPVNVEVIIPTAPPDYESSETTYLLPTETKTMAY